MLLIKSVPRTIGIVLVLLISCYAGAILITTFQVGIAFLSDSDTNGKFEYATAAELKEIPEIKLPGGAKNIVLYRFGLGHKIRFEITSEELMNWIEQMRSINPELNKNREHENQWHTIKHEMPESKVIELQEIYSEIFDNRFSKTGWKYDPQMHEYQVTFLGNGNGFTIYHVPKSNVAYLSAAYR